MRAAIIAGALVVASLVAAPLTRAQQDGSFQKFIEGVWPEAQKAGVSRVTFDRAFKGVTPDLSLPDLVLPGKQPSQSRGQAEFVRPPQDYLNRAQLIQLATNGRAFMAKHLPLLEKIEKEIGVERHVDEVERDHLRVDQVVPVVAHTGHPQADRELCLSTHVHRRRRHGDTLRPVVPDRGAGCLVFSEARGLLRREGGAGLGQADPLRHVQLLRASGRFDTRAYECLWVDRVPQRPPQHLASLPERDPDETHRMCT